MKTYQRALIIFLSSLTLNACAPGLGSGIKLIPISVDSGDKSPEETLSELPVAVSKFEDRREKQEIARIDDRLIPPNGDVGLTVEEGFEHEFRRRGARIGSIQGVRVTGEVQQWYMEVTPKFPLNEVVANAGVLVRIERDGAPLFQATYSGAVQSKEAIVSERKAEKLLSVAMAKAIEEAITDQDFLRNLQAR